MNCDKANKLLAEYVFDELDEKARADVSAHLGRCPECRQLVEDMRLTVALLRDGAEAATEPTLTADRKRALLAAVDKADAEGTPLRFVRRAKDVVAKRWVLHVAAIVAICALIAGILLPGLSRASEDARRARTMNTLGFVQEGWKERKAAAEPVAMADLSAPEESDFRRTLNSLRLEGGRAEGTRELSDLDGALGAISGRLGERGHEVTFDLGKLDWQTTTFASNEERDSAPRDASSPSAPRSERRPASTVGGERAKASEPSDEWSVVQEDLSQSPQVFAAPSIHGYERENAAGLALGGDVGQRAGDAGVRGPGGATLDRRARLQRDEEPLSHAETARRESREFGFEEEGRKLAAEDPFAKQSVRTPERSQPPVEAKQPPSERGTDLRKEAEAEADEGKAVLRARLGDVNEVLDAYRADELDKALDHADRAKLAAPDDPAVVELHRRISREKEARERQQALPQPKPEAEPPPATSVAPPVNPWEMTAEDRFSTFALNVDTASYAMARNAIRRGYLPPKHTVRMEEFVNAFDYNYPGHTDRVFTVHAQAAPSPFGDGLTLLKLGVRGKVVGRDGRKPAHLVLVVDASGSMAQADRMPLVQFALGTLLDQLGEADVVSLVVYRDSASLVLESVPASRKGEIKRALDAIQCRGSTNLLAGLRLGYEMAARAFRPGAVNRVVLCTDGVANVGAVEADEMLEHVSVFRKHGIAFTGVGFGALGYNDDLMERLANRGDGAYVFVDSQSEAKRVFEEEIAGTLQTIAYDAKIQVEFNPERVRRYRLIGYEKRDVADEDFRDDTVEGGAVGSGQSATALYELELIPRPVKAPMRLDALGSAMNLGVLRIRYRDADTLKVEEIAEPLPDTLVQRLAPEQAPRFYLAASAAEFAELLRESEHARGGSLEKVRAVLERVVASLPLDAQAAELLGLAIQAKGLPRAE